MTNSEMRERIREINRERNRLREEKESYEKLLAQEMEKNIVEEHRKHIGECYMSTSSLKNTYIKAFKILNVLEKPSDYAECLVLIDGSRSNCWKEVGVAIMTLGLWTFNDLHLMNKESDLKVIQCCRMITEEEFKVLLEQHMANMEEAAER